MKKSHQTRWNLITRPLQPATSSCLAVYQWSQCWLRMPGARS